MMKASTSRPPPTATDTRVRRPTINSGSLRISTTGRRSPRRSSRHPEKIWSTTSSRTHSYAFHAVVTLALIGVHRKLPAARCSATGSGSGTSASYRAWCPSGPSTAGACVQRPAGGRSWPPTSRTASRPARRPGPAHRRPVAGHDLGHERRHPLARRDAHHRPHLCAIPPSSPYTGVGFWRLGAHRGQGPALPRSRDGGAPPVDVRHSGGGC
jgi:hypothetical protein